MAAMLFNGLDYRIGNRECLFLDHLQGFFGIGSEQINNYSRSNYAIAK